MTKDDFQSIIIERVRKLDKEVKSIKVQQKNQFKKLEVVDIQGFHDQIQALDKRIDRLEENMLYTQRILAKFIINIYQLNMQEEVQREHMNPNVRETIIVEQTKAAKDVELSSEPIRVALKFIEFCIKYSKQVGIEVFRDY